MMQTETKRNTKTKGKRKSGDQLKIIATLVYRTQYKCICKHFFFFFFFLKAQYFLDVMKSCISDYCMLYDCLDVDSKNLNLGI